MILNKDDARCNTASGPFTELHVADVRYAATPSLPNLTGNRTSPKTGHFSTAFR